MRVLYDRVAAIDVHKDMVKVAVRVPGERRGTRKTDVLEFLPAQPAACSASPGPPRTPGNGPPAGHPAHNGPRPAPTRCAPGTGSSPQLFPSSASQ